MDGTQFTVSSEPLYTGERIVVRMNRTRLPQGPFVSTETVEHPDSVVIVAIDDHLNVLLVRQYRPAIGLVLVELPAGTIEQGESPIACARRELREETGFAAEEFKSIGGFWSAPGFCTEYLHAFLATNLYHDPLPADTDEQIEAQWMKVTAAIEQAYSGGFYDAKSIAALASASRLILGD